MLCYVPDADASNAHEEEEPKPQRLLGPESVSGVGGDYWGPAQTVLQSSDRRGLDITCTPRS